MGASLRRHYANLLTSAVHLALVVVGFRIDTPMAWTIVLSLIGTISVLAWTGNHRRYRLIADTPTSRVVSAAQGYVELDGRARAHPDAPVLSRLTGLPCCWHRYLVERRENAENWVREEEWASTDTFLLDDGTGVAVIDPEDAEISTRHKQVSQKGDYRYTEWMILPHDPIYALGEFFTLSGDQMDLDVNRDTSALLAEWKKERARLQERFDRDGNGEISLEEWEIARREARREVERQHLEVRLQPGTHVLRRPRDGRPFLLSNLNPEKLVLRYRLWGFAHLAVMVVAAVGAVWKFA
jgi:hypothetical protein